MVILLKNQEENGKSNSFNSLVFCPILNLLITSSENLIKIWKLDKKGRWNRKSPQVLQGHKFRINFLSCLYLSGKGALLASASSSEKSYVKLWHLNLNGLWDGKDPETLEIKTWMIKSIAMQSLADRGVLLAVGGGEYGDKLSVWCLTSELKWNKKDPLFLKGFTYWSYPVALCSFNGRILLVVSGSWMEPYHKIWTFDMRGNWNGNLPLKLNLPPNQDYESNYPRSFSMCKLNDDRAVLVTAIGSDEDEYLTADAGYIIAWTFNARGELVNKKPLILGFYPQPVKRVVVFPFGVQEFLLAYSITSNKIGIKFLKEVKGIWKEYDNIFFELEDKLRIGCFVPAGKDFLFVGISRDELISWRITI